MDCIVRHTENRAGKGRSVFQTILIPLLSLLAVEAVFLVGSLRASGVMDRLNQNARDIMNQNVTSRENYLEHSMVDSWSDLTFMEREITEATLWRLVEGSLTLEDLDNSSDACMSVLTEVVDDMISTLYSKKASGIFLIFNTHPEEGGSRTGVYIRNLDPSAKPSTNRDGLLLERAPVSLLQGAGISADANWKAEFTQADLEKPMFQQPYQAALQAGRVDSPAEYGYWSIQTLAVEDGVQNSIAYSIPLVLPDGTVFGVLGVDRLTTHLRGMLPAEELMENGQGSYLLAVTKDGGEQYTVSMVSGPIWKELSVGDPLELKGLEEGAASLSVEGEKCYVYGEPMELYGENSPFVEEQWYLLGVAPERWLYAFSRQMRLYLYGAILCTLFSGVLGSLFISRRISKPIHRLAGEVEQSWREQGGLPQLSITGITEMDRFSQAFASVSREVVEASTKFLQIMEMASVDMGGFEVRRNEDRVFVTDNLFALFGREDIPVKGMTVARFRQEMEELYQSLAHTTTEEGELLFHVPTEQGEVRYVRVETREDEERYVGLAEDVTAATQERMRIERERDQDPLTGLCSRWAFYRQAEELFRSPEKLKHAALVMLDLDQLKQTNDRFGHDWGDRYIHQAGRCFAAAVPPGTLCARVSGDEFYLLYYGYSSREEARQRLPELVDAIRSSSFELPNGERISIRASGGVSWYPEDSRSFGELMRYADFAMYQMKRHQKGSLGEFDLGTYNREHHLLESRREFRQLLEEGLIHYHFQPLLDVGTGEPAAYEALMRVDLPTLKSPVEVLRLAKESNRLKEIERLTWYKTAEAYQSLLDRERVSKNAMLFVNSIASQHLTPEEREDLSRRYHGLQARIVIELTEAEEMDEEATLSKREAPGFSGMFALDDYGSGYNSEKNLLILGPKFIKVDISIIRRIDRDVDKQQIVSNVVSYAHDRNMFVVAEGLETAAETWKVLELGVDLLQGYYLARPGAVPPQVNQEALELIRRFWREHPDLEWRKPKLPQGPWDLKE